MNCSGAGFIKKFVVCLFVFLFVKERRNEAKRGRRRDRKHPERGIYQPPHLRSREAMPRSGTNNPAAPVYKLEIEVAPKQWHRQNIEKVNELNRA